MIGRPPRSTRTATLFPYTTLFRSGVVGAPGWHPGVIGIVAGRLKEKLHRPAIVIALDEDGVGKGSGRSIGGVDLGAAILAAKETGLLVAGGGHAMAAGLTVAADRIDALGAFLNDRLAADRSDARRIGKECVSTGRSRLCTYY